MPDLLPKDPEQFEMELEVAECYFEGSEMGDIQELLIAAIRSMRGINMYVEANILWYILESINADMVNEPELRTEIKKRLFMLQQKRGHKFIDDAPGSLCEYCDNRSFTNGGFAPCPNLNKP